KRSKVSGARALVTRDTVVPATKGDMNGTMLWFNEAKDHGFILTEEGERLAVAGTDFADGLRPKGRCGRAAVSFVLAAGSVRKAENVAFLSEANPRRARLRRRGI